MARDGQIMKNFNVKRKLKINQKIAVKIKAGNYEGEHSTQIVDIIDQDTFVINTPYFEGKLVNLSRNRKFNILVKEGNGIYDLPVQIIDRKVESTHLLVVKLIDKVRKIQQRSFFRLEIYEDIKYRVVADSEEDLNEGNKSNESNKSYEGIIEDISGGGLRLSAQEKVGEGKILEFNFDFANFSYSNIMAKIIRRFEKKSEDQTHYSYGTRFIYMEKREREELISWLFNKQRELRKKGLI